MMTPQLTEQYGQVLRVSVAREIFRLWVWAYTGARSNPKADRPTPPTRVPLRKVLRENSIVALRESTYREETEVAGCDRRRLVPRRPIFCTAPKGGVKLYPLRLATVNAGEGSAWYC